ncbi:MAG: hypothetical protein KC776_08865 [Myxococcales bacterium]|nr:hypothetical protein [Myxococcales bacterium]MCB9578880.1 hypothetical protein [Polyangiaceae bacterium]
MAETERKKKRGKKAPRRERKERRFVGNQTQSSTVAAVAGMLGAGALGAGVYAQWIKDPPMSYGSYIVAGGALVLGAALWFGDAGAIPVRVGDAGVAVEKGTEIIRLAWCDLERIYVERSYLVLSGDGLKLELPMAAHKAAAARILKEAVERVPDVLDVKQSATDSLPEPKDDDGEWVTITGVQVAGKRCAESGEVITFEGDARLCPSCGQVYHRNKVPKKCVTCEADLAGHAVRP